jgi:hypothetical protein
MIELPNEQLLVTAHAAVRGWLIPFASRIGSHRLLLSIELAPLLASRAKLLGEWAAADEMWS